LHKDLSTASGGMTPRILICDDEVAVADELSEFFGLSGWVSVATYSSSEARRRLLHSYEFDCLLTDNAMPEETGLSLIAFARSLYAPYKPLVSCVMTGMMVDMPEFSTEVLRVQKPFDAFELQCRMRDLLEAS